MNVLLLCRYGPLGASSRYRSYQYLPYLQGKGINVTPAPLLDDNYLTRLYNKDPKSYTRFFQSYLQRVLHLLRARSYDLVWIEKEALPWVPHWFELLIYHSGLPYVVDYDDALFHRYNQHPSHLVRWLLGKKIDAVMERASVVVAGNRYLGEWARKSGATRVVILPTVVDLDRYQTAPLPERSTFTIGWIGSPSTSRYLHCIAEALQQVCADGRTQVVTVGAPRLKMSGVPIHTKLWNQSTEVQDLQSFDVGIMPLQDTPWERGKCGLKLIQYMAVSRPVIASPVGVNSELVDHGKNGFLASTMGEWVQALQCLKENMLFRKEMGLAGRALVEEQYALDVTAPKLAAILQDAANDVR